MASSVIRYSRIDMGALRPISEEENDILDLDKKQYGLILIDESHKFRNSETQMYKQAGNAVSVNTIYAILYYLITNRIIRK